MQYFEFSPNQPSNIEYRPCHMGSTLLASVLRNRFNADNDIHACVPVGATTLVYGSASNEYKHPRGSAVVLSAQSQSTIVGGLSDSDVDTDVSVCKFGIPRDDNNSSRYVERS
jgi:S-ribosylhomocysteine lyase LuxS involved in autoinducer biosynthesis